MTSLRHVLDGLTQEGADFVVDAPEDWAQGRTLYGGITAAFAYEAVRRAHGELPGLRSAQISFIGPAAGHLRFSSSMLRRGRSSALIAADCVNADGAVARGLFVFGAARESKVEHDFLPMPGVDPPADCAPFRKEGPDAPRGFWNNFETRLASGGRLFEATAPRPEFSVWTRFRDVGAADRLTALIAIADCLPPAAMVRFSKPAPISTMTWTVDVLNPPDNAEGWFLLNASSEYAREGYSMQAMTLWGEDGVPLAVGRQAVAIFC